MPAPSGILSLPMLYLRNLIAQSAAFQTWVSHGGSAANAATHVYYDAFPTDAGGLNAPFAVIAELPEDDVATEFEEEARAHFTARMILGVEFFKDLTRASALDDEIMQMRNDMGGIIQDMMQFANAGTAGALGPVLTGAATSRSSIEASHPDDYENETEMDDYLVMSIQWASEGPV